MAEKTKDKALTDDQHETDIPGPMFLVEHLFTSKYPELDYRVGHFDDTDDAFIECYGLIISFDKQEKRFRISTIPAALPLSVINAILLALNSQNSKF